VLGRLFLLFTLVPLVELYLLISIGGSVGVAPTIALIALTGILGAWLAKREGRKTLASYQEAMTQGRLPEDGIVSGLLILVGGVLLIAPGVLTDVVGLALMIPPIRRGVAKLITRRVEARIRSGELQVMHIGSGPGFGPGFGAPIDGHERAPNVVDVEVVDVEARG
jgi:UPF0716 protein FxsA